jgi:LmbE family N-acetylglucosaminyl deacetylase/ActR/RegA family two-component response regulator
LGGKVSHPYRVVIVEDGLQSAAAFAGAIEMQGGTVALCQGANSRERVSRLRPDAVIVGTARLDLISGIRSEHPGLPVIVVSPEPSVDAAVRALRNGANEFLIEPVSPAEIGGHIARLGDAYRLANTVRSGRQTVLAIGAHPDDVEVGVGGILAAHSLAGDPVTVLTLSKGRREGGVQLAWEEGAAAASVIGARLLLEDSIESAGSALAVIARVVAELKPTIVYVHSKHDRRQDHRAVHEATVAATEEIGTVACYQGTTGTVEYQPTRFIPIDAVLEQKLAMIACFASRGERADYLHPEFVVATARYWSQFGQGRHCEPLEVIRESALNPVGPALVPDVWQIAHEGGRVGV